MNLKWADIHIAGMHSRHICRTDVCKHPALFIPLRMGVTELAGAYPTTENKAREERWGWVGELVAAGRWWWWWSSNGDISLQLLHFVVAAQEAA